LNKETPWIYSMISLLRPKHWLKNTFVSLPLVLSGQFDNDSRIILAILVFCLASSAVYIFNDLRDAESDRKHEIKKKRPLACRAVSQFTAVIFCISFALFALIFDCFIFSSPLTISLLLAYFLLNCGYSLILKDVPITDVLILSCGFMLRMLYGTFIVGQGVPVILYLTIFSMSLYMSFGKRKNELSNYGENAVFVRRVLKFYSKPVLDKSFRLFFVITNILYIIWAAMMFMHGNGIFLLTVPLFFFICLRYNKITETAESANPVDSLFSDKILLLMVISYVALVLAHTA